MNENITSTSLTPSQESYLEWVYRFSEHGDVRVSDIAKKLGVSLPSVSRAVGNLSKMGLLSHSSYGKIGLTAEGIAAGKAILRRDKCLHSLLEDVLAVELSSKSHVKEQLLSTTVLPRLELLIRHAVADPVWLKKFHAGLRDSVECEERVEKPTMSGAKYLSEENHARQ